MIELNFLYDKFEEDDEENEFMMDQPDLLELQYQENFVLKIIGRFVNARSAVKYVFWPQDQPFLTQLQEN